MLHQVIEINELLDSAGVSGAAVAELFQSMSMDNIEIETVSGAEGATDFVKILIEGAKGKTRSGSSPTLGIIGRLGGVGARPTSVGLVSDADGAIGALACALKLVSMQKRGDVLDGDVIVATHICPNAPIIPHDPVPFMSSPVAMHTMNKYELDPRMDAVLSIDATKGNRVLNQTGFALTPTIKEGYILPVAPDLIDIMQWVTGAPAAVLAISTQDITPYGNGLDHVNSILQPATATESPVVGVALTAEIPVPGCATGASREVDIEAASRFCIEVAKGFGSGTCRFYDEANFDALIERYGSMRALQTMGKNS